MVSNPVKLSLEVSNSLTLETVEEFKRTECAEYNACLGVAVKEDWPNFSCNHCDNYTLPDYQQRISDVLALKVVFQASEYILQDGNASRIKGVKPGERKSKSCKPAGMLSPHSLNQGSTQSLIPPETLIR